MHENNLDFEFRRPQYSLPEKHHGMSTNLATRRGNQVNVLQGYKILDISFSPSFWE